MSRINRTFIYTTVDFECTDSAIGNMSDETQYIQDPCEARHLEEKQGFYNNTTRRETASKTTRASVNIMNSKTFQKLNKTLQRP